MNTAMQELIEYTENLKSTYNFSFDKFFTKANELLEKEKKQIQNAYDAGSGYEGNWEWEQKHYDSTFGNSNEAGI